MVLLTGIASRPQRQGDGLNPKVSTAQGPADRCHAETGVEGSLKYGSLAKRMPDKDKQQPWPSHSPILLTALSSMLELP